MSRPTRKKVGNISKPSERVKRTKSHTCEKKDRKFSEQPRGRKVVKLKSGRRDSKQQKNEKATKKVGKNLKRRKTIRNHTGQDLRANR